MLDAPIARVGAAFAPIPFSPPLERAIVPDRTAIIAAVEQVLAP
jgi:pyruvate dehydrogenase E1 component beta subunit